jgi:hypothetical protein
MLDSEAENAPLAGSQAPTRVDITADDDSEEESAALCGLESDSRLIPKEELLTQEAPPLSKWPPLTPYRQKADAEVHARAMAAPLWSPVGAVAQLEEVIARTSHPADRASSLPSLGTTPSFTTPDPKEEVSAQPSIEGGVERKNWLSVDTGRQDGEEEVAPPPHPRPGAGDALDSLRLLHRQRA